MYVISVHVGMYVYTVCLSGLVKNTHHQVHITTGLANPSEEFSVFHGERTPWC